MNKVILNYIIKGFIKNFLIVVGIFYCFGFILNLFEEIEFFKNLEVSILTPLVLTSIYIPSLIIKILPFSKHHEAHALSAIKMFKDKPITGQGPNAFRYLCNDEKYHVNLACTTHPHQLYLQILSETGLLGFIFMVCLLFFVSLRILQLMIENIKDKYFNYYNNSEFFILIAIFVNLFPLVPSNNFFNNWINILYYLPFGFYLSIIFKKNK